MVGTGAEQFRVYSGRGWATSPILVEPPDGRLPPLTSEAQQDEKARRAARSTRGPADTWTDLDLNDRCMLWSAGPPMLPAGYNSY